MGKTKSLQLWPGQSDNWQTLDNVEVSHTIVERISDVERLYSIDALTSKKWLRLLAVDYSEEERKRLIELMHERSRWNSTREMVFIPFSPVNVQSVIEYSYSSGASFPPKLISESALAGNAQTVSSRDWVLSSDEVLSRLEESTTHNEELITAVLFAEITTFDSEQKTRLVKALFEFVRKYRFASDEEVITAVGAGIRKLAMNMPTTAFEDYSRLLTITPTATLSCRIELELVKALNWRLISVVELHGEECPQLKSALADLALAYLAPRLVLQENYASIVINAVIATGLLSGDRQNELIDRVAGLNLLWFSELVARRLLEYAEKREKLRHDLGSNLMRLRKRLISATD